MVPDRLRGRRNALSLLAGALPAAALLSCRPGLAAAPPTTPLPDNPLVLVGCPPGGALDKWAALVRDAASRLLPTGLAPRLINVGGPDGVTAANRLEAEAMPDGATALLAPGEAALAWLAGDPRAKFEASRWVPVVAGWSPGVVMHRARPLDQGGRVRVPVASPADGDIAALVGLALMGLPTRAVRLVDDPVAAFAQGRIDAFLLSGPDLPARLRAAAEAGATPLFTLGNFGDPADAARDPALRDIPTLSDCSAAAAVAPEIRAALEPAWSAVAAAAQMRFALVLPLLTPAVTVAWWRQIAPSVALAAPGADPHVVEGAAFGNAFAGIAADMQATLTLRRWLAAQPGWQPG